MNHFFAKLQPVAQNGMRVMVGLALWTHGAQKLFGWFTDREPMALMSSFGAAGIIEVFAGGMVILGLYHRPAAFLISGEMAVTYFWMHAGRSGELFWWANRGELPMVFAFVFLLIAAFGGGDFSIDGLLKKRQAASA